MSRRQPRSMIQIKIDPTAPKEEIGALLDLLRETNGNYRRMSGATLLKKVLDGKIQVPRSFARDVKSWTPAKAMAVARHGLASDIPHDLLNEENIITALQHGWAMGYRCKMTKITENVAKAYVSAKGRPNRPGDYLPDLPKEFRTFEVCRLALQDFEIAGTFLAVPDEHRADLIAQAISIVGDVYYLMGGAMDLSNLEAVALTAKHPIQYKYVNWTVDKALLVLRNIKDKTQMLDLIKSVPESILCEVFHSLPTKLSPDTPR